MLPVVRVDALARGLGCVGGASAIGCGAGVAGVAGALCGALGCVAVVVLERMANVITRPSAISPMGKMSNSANSACWFEKPEVDRVFDGTPQIIDMACSVCSLLKTVPGSYG